jgi:hypothetical protein
MKITDEGGFFHSPVNASFFDSLERSGLGMS